MRPEAFDRIVAATQAAGRVPSLVAGAVEDGRLVHLGGAGQLPPPAPDLQYRIGSISKTMTAALVLRLRDEDRLSLDDRVERHLPGTPAGAARLRDLLAHVAGIPREPEGEWWERSPGRPLSGLAIGPTAGRYHYSNLAYGLLGAIVERVAGEPWWDQLGKRVLQPLGMHRTTYHPAEPFARGYVVHPWHGTLREEPRYDAGPMAPAGQLWSTIEDLARWAAFLTDPDPAVLSPATVAQMCAPAAIADPDGWHDGYGLGLRLWRRGERVYAGHTGSMPGYLAVLAVHRPSRTGVVAYSNAYTLAGTSIADLGLDLLDAVVDGVPAALASWRPGAAPPPGIEALTGRWWWMGREHEAYWDGAARELVVYPVARPGDRWCFTPEGPDRWRCHSGSNDGEVLTVRRAASGAVRTLDIATAVFTRDPWVI